MLLVPIKLSYITVSKHLKKKKFYGNTMLIPGMYKWTIYSFTEQMEECV